MTPGEFRLRICYEKAGRLRWLSHLEVAHAIERIIRRAGLEFALTQGFKPRMKIAFGPALPVGTAGLREYADVWLTRYNDTDEVLDRLKQAAPAGLIPVEARYVADAVPALAAALVIGHYRVLVGGEESDSTAVQAGFDAVLSKGVLEIEHKGKTKVFDLARSVPKDVRIEDVNGGVVIEIAIRMGPEGSLRPETLVRTALSEAGVHTSVLHTTRLDLLVEDEEGNWSRPV